MSPRAAATPELRFRLTGHKFVAVHKGYTHLELATLKQAIRRLPNLPKTA